MEKMDRTTPQAGQTSKKQQVKDHVISRVFDGSYPPGMILSEKTLVEELAFSKSPVREALVELCRENILRNIPRLGYEVIRLTGEDVYDIRNLRLALECGFLRRYGAGITPDKLRELGRLLEEAQGTADSDILKNWEANTRFHLALFSAYQNQYAYHVLEDALNRQTRAFAQFYWDKWRKRRLIVQEEIHKRLLEVLEAGDLETAAQVLEQDICEYNGLDLS